MTYLVYIFWLRVIFEVKMGFNNNKKKTMRDLAVLPPFGSLFIILL